MVSDLADLYRYLLHHPEDAPLQSEVGHAQQYLAIEQARLGDGRLTVSTDIDPSTQGARVPALLLQPLVENAVKHGIAPFADGGSISIVAKITGNQLQIDIEDRGVGETIGRAEKGTGMALDTLRKRLTKRFGDGATLELHRGDHGTRATVTMPCTIDHD